MYLLNYTCIIHLPIAKMVQPAVFHSCHRAYAGWRPRVRSAQLARIRSTPVGRTQFNCGAYGLRYSRGSGPHPPGGLNSVVARMVCAAAPDRRRTRRTDCHSRSYRQVWRRVGADLHIECDCCANLLIRKRTWHRCKCCLGNVPPAEFGSL